MVGRKLFLICLVQNLPGPVLPLDYRSCSVIVPAARQFLNLFLIPHSFKRLEKNDRVCLPELFSIHRLFF